MLDVWMKNTMAITAGSLGLDCAAECAVDPLHNMSTWCMPHRDDNRDDNRALAWNAMDGMQ